MGEFISDRIRSVRNQTCRQIAIYVADDVSKRDARAFNAPLLADPRTYYNQQLNAGKGVAKNAGTRASRGRYGASSDADNLWRPKGLKLQLHPAVCSPSVGVADSRSQRLNADGTWLGPYPIPELNGRTTERILCEKFVPFGLVMIRADAPETLGRFHEIIGLAMSRQILLRLSAHCAFAFMIAVTYLHRISEGRLSSRWIGRSKNAFHVGKECLPVSPGTACEAVVTLSITASDANRGHARVSQSCDYSRDIRDTLTAAQKGCKPNRTSRLLVCCRLILNELVHGLLGTARKAQQ